MQSLIKFDIIHIRRGQLSQAEIFEKLCNKLL